MTDIVEQINKLIKGWEMEYGITNKTMVAARDEVLRLNDELSMARAQCLIRADRIKNLMSGPGGIMEMKQTIADKETEIARLEQYESMVHYIANDYIELSYEKAQCQRDDWLKRCRKTIAEAPPEWTENYGQGSEPWLKDDEK